MRSLYPLCMVWLFAEKHNKMWLLASDWLATPGLNQNHFQATTQFQSASCYETLWLVFALESVKM